MEYRREPIKTASVSIQRITIVLAVLGIAVLLSAIANSSHMEKNIARLQKMERDWSECEQYVLMLQTGSDTLTHSVYAFATTGEVQYMDAYWREADETRSRDIAIEKLFEFDLTGAELLFARRARNNSELLLQREVWAMRMVCESLGIPPSRMPARVAACTVGDADSTLADDEKRARAVSYLYSTDYESKKRAIDDDIAELRLRLSTRFSDETLAVSATIANEIRSGTTLLITILLFLLAIMLLYYLLVNRPIDRYTETIASSQSDLSRLTLKPLGSSEIRRFAESFNQLSEKLRAAQDDLRLSEQEFRIASQQNAQLIQRYDIETKTVYRHDTVAQQFGMPQAVYDVPDSLLATDVIAPESRADFLAFYQAMQRGESAGSASIHMRRRAIPANDYRWYQATFSMLSDADGKPRHGIITYRDITEQREKETVYRKWQQEIQTLSTQNSVIFEYNLTTGALENFINFLDIGPANPKLDMARQMSVYLRQIHPEDRAAFLLTFNQERLVGAYLKGNTEFSLDFRAKLHERYLWLNAHIQLVPYPDSAQIKAYVIVKDVDAKKREDLSMRDRAQNDGLTKVLNRAAFTEAVNTLLMNEPDAQHAIFMLDLDGFKQVNDTIGHGGGDKCLVNVASTLKSLLRPGDLLGRVGGDEFMLCLRNVTDEAGMRKRAALICERLHTTLENGCRLSVSLGAAMYSRDGDTFDALYRNADAAMYFAKHTGRNRCAFFESAQLEHVGKNNPTPIDAAADAEE